MHSDFRPALITRRTWGLGQSCPVWTPLVSLQCRPVYGRHEGAVTSVGPKGDSYDSTAESIIWLYKAELITMGGLWCTIDEAELALNELAGASPN